MTLEFEQEILAAIIRFNNSIETEVKLWGKQEFYIQQKDFFKISPVNLARLEKQRKEHEEEITRCYHIVSGLMKILYNKSLTPKDFEVLFSSNHLKTLLTTYRINLPVELPSLELKLKFNLS